MAAMAIALAIAAVVVGASRVRQMPEWLALTGDVDARIAACRDLSQKEPRRAERMLRRLLRDASPDVQAAALEAASRRQLPALEPTIVELLEAADRRVQVQAWEALMGVCSATPESWRARLRELLVDDVALESADLLAAYAAAAPEDDHPWLLQQVLQEHQHHPKVQELLLRHPASLRSHREVFINQLDQPELPARRRAFVLAALAAMDGGMRGFTAADWRQADQRPSGQPTAPVDGFVVEAEWAYDLQPNFMIEAWKDELALALHEGAGGYLAWLGRDNSTVDIGSGKLPFTLSRAGNYVLWARIHMQDKCGNSTGMTVNGQQYSAFSDSTDIFHQWIWMAHGTMYLREGRHVLDLKALEDGVQVDKYAILPPGEHPDDNPQRLNYLYDPATPPSISFAAEMQHQLRGTTQTVTVWLRRNTLELTGGTLTVNLPAPFVLVDGDTSEVRFAGDEPLVRSSFRVHLPTDALGGEVEMTAILREDGRVLAEGSFFLGVQLDWYTTGRLAHNDPRTLRLLQAHRIDRQEVLDSWQPYPHAGYDRYRRLDFEDAFGQSQNCIVFLYTELQIGQAGRYYSYLTSDDTSRVMIGGKTVVSQDTNGPGEGRMRVAATHLEAGRVQVLVWVTQADFADPVGADADRHSYNNWTFKWLLRPSRHTIEPSIKSLPLR